MNLRKKTLWAVVLKGMLASCILWLWSANCSAYDFELTCYGTDGTCGPGVSFSLHKIGTSSDSTELPFAPIAIQFYLANCPSDTSCSKLVGPVWEKGISLPGGIALTYGYLASNYLTGVNNVLNGSFVTGANSGTAEPTWNGNIYKYLCLSISPVNPTYGWEIWGVNYTYSPGAVMCSVPLNRVVADTCSVSTQTLDIDFGQIERSEIGTTSGGTNDQKKSVSLSCTGSATHNFSLKLNMTPVGWSTSQIATSNAALGISVQESGVILNNGDSFTLSVAGSGSTELTFSVLKNPSIANSAIVTGDFSASATLIITES